MITLVNWNNIFEIVGYAKERLFSIIVGTDKNITI